MYRVKIGKQIIPSSKIQQQVAIIRSEKDGVKLKNLNSQKSELLQIMANYLNQQSTRVDTIDKLAELNSRTS